MPTINPNRRRRSRFGFILMTMASLVVLGVGLMLTLWAVGVPFWSDSAPDPYLVRIPINSRAIAAYSKVDRRDLLNPESGWLMFQELPPQAAVGMAISGVDSKGKAAEGRVASVRKHEGSLQYVLDSGQEIPSNRVSELGGALMNVSAIVGRVVRKDKSPGFGFREETFFPKGTPEGLAGATPPGMRAMVLEAASLKGVHSLPAGARIDLMANVPLSDLSSFDRGHNSRLPGAALVLSSSKKQGAGGRTEPIMLAQEAMVLKPVYQRVEATASATLAQGTRVQAVPVYEVALAVHPGDVIPLQNALNNKLKVICVAHSMRGSDEKEETTPQVATAHVAPVTSRSILAYEVLTYDYFEDAATRQIRHESVSQEEIERLGVVTSMRQLMGAVVKHDIPKGSFITEADLLRMPAEKSTPAIETRTHADETIQAPEGSHFITQQSSTQQEPAADAATNRRGPRPTIIGDVPGISSFIPPGHKAVAIPWNRLYGAEHLQIGDRVDLTVSYSLQYNAESKEQERQPDGTVIERTIQRRASEPTERTYDETLGFRGEPWFAALNAKVIGPVGYPPPAAAMRFLGDSLFQANSADSSSTPRSGPPIMLAVDERDQEAISAALATEQANFSVIIHPQGGETEVPQGWKRIVLAPKGIDAFEQVTSTELEQPHTRRLLTRLVRSDDARFKLALTEKELQPYFGRVLKSYKTRHGFFSENDFFPEGVRPGFAADVSDGNTVYVAADRDIDGLEHFRTDDRVAILFRGITKRPEGVIAYGIDLQQPTATVVVREARILRASQEGKTVLEVSNEDLTRLQAAWAAAFTEGGNQQTNERLPLVAVSLPAFRQGALAKAPLFQTAIRNKRQSLEIAPYDPLSNVHVLEAIKGDRRKTYVFAGDEDNASDTPSVTIGR